MNGNPVVKVENLRKRYGTVQAVDGVSFAVEPSEIFGMVGPNGAGKTTAVECIEGLRRPDDGAVCVLGLDPWRDSRELRERIGVQLQTANLPQRIKVSEAMDLFASFYRRQADGRALLERLGLADKRRTYVSQLSGGQRQRLFVALALINHPEVVFLDELTTGLDPQARRDIWDLMRDIRAQGVTVFLTTHFMDEAERLCDRVAILNDGRIIALDTPVNLVRRPGTGSRVVFDANGGLNLAILGVLNGVQQAEREGDQVVVRGQGAGLIAVVANALEASGIRYWNLRAEQANLEDVFLSLTGKMARGA